MPWFKLGKYNVSRYNFDDQVTAQYDFPEEVTVYDGTIRKLMMTPGVRLVEDEVIDIVTAIEDVGLKHIFSFIFHPHDNNVKDCPSFRLCKAISDQGFKLDQHTTFSYNISRKNPDGPRWKDTIDVLIDAGVDTAEIPVYGSDLICEQEKGVELMRKLFEYAKERGMKTSIGAINFGMLPFDFLISYINEATEYGAEFVSLYDSYSSLNPDGMKNVIKIIKNKMIREIPLIVHIHDDYGLATAACVAAVTAGAQPEASWNGISYRAGFAALEEVVLVLEILYGISTGIKLEKLYDMSKLVEEKTELKCQPHKAVTGEQAFCRGGWGVEEFLRGSLDLTSYNPEIVGQKEKVVWEKVTLSTRAVDAKLDNMGLKYNQEDVSKISNIIQKRLDKIKKYPYLLTDSEVEEICRKVIYELKRERL